MVSHSTHIKTINFSHMLQFVLVYVYINIAAYTVAICTIATFFDAACTAVYASFMLLPQQFWSHLNKSVFAILGKHVTCTLSTASSKSFTLSTASTIRKHVTLHTSKNISFSYMFTFVLHLKIFIYVYIEYCFLYYLRYSDLFCSSLCSF